MMTLPQIQKKLGKESLVQTRKLQVLLLLFFAVSENNISGHYWKHWSASVVVGVAGLIRLQTLGIPGNSIYETNISVVREV